MVGRNKARVMLRNVSPKRESIRLEIELNGRQVATETLELEADSTTEAQVSWPLAEASGGAVTSIASWQGKAFGLHRNMFRSRTDVDPMWRVYCEFLLGLDNQRMSMCCDTHEVALWPTRRIC